MTPGHDGFGAPEVLANEPPRRRVPRSLLLAAGAALVVVAGAGVATAAAFSPSPAPAPTAEDTAKGTPEPAPTAGPSDKVRGPGWGWGRHHRFGFDTLHGEYVVRDRDGGFVTVATQFGDVTAVTQDSITVKSEDGYTREYAVTGDTRVRSDGEGVSGLQAGDKVKVRATVAGDTATAVTIIDVTAWADRTGRDWRDKGPWHRDRMPGGPDRTPEPTPTETS
jgi:hypothetical protein